MYKIKNKVQKQNEVDWKIKNTFFAYKKSIQESDSSREVLSQIWCYMLSSFIIFCLMGEGKRENDQGVNGPW